MAFMWRQVQLAGFIPVRAVLAVIFMLFTAVGPALAQADPPAAEPAWQAAITAQLDAFRSGNAIAAFSFASREFHLSFPTARASTRPSWAPTISR